MTTEADLLHVIDAGRRVGWAKFYDAEKRLGSMQELADRYMDILGKCIGQWAYESVIDIRKVDGDWFETDRDCQETRARGFVRDLRRYGINLQWAMEQIATDKVPDSYANLWWDALTEEQRCEFRGPLGGPAGIPTYPPPVEPRG